MFKSFKCNYDFGKHYTNPENHNQFFYPHIIEIIDDDFTESITIYVLGTLNNAYSVYKGTIAAAISIYSKRNLEVLPNLFILIKFFIDRAWCSFEELYEELLEFVPSYKEYHEDILRYFKQKVFW